MFLLVPQIFIKQFIVYYYKADHVLIYVLDFLPCRVRLKTCWVLGIVKRCVL